MRTVTPKRLYVHIVYCNCIACPVCCSWLCPLSGNLALGGGSDRLWLFSDGGIQPVLGCGCLVD